MVSHTSFSRRRFLAGGAGLVALAFAAPANATSTGVRIVNSNGLRLRSSPSLSGSVLASLASGTAVNYLDSAGYGDGYDWAYVEVRSTGTQGYVADQFLSVPDSGEFPTGSTVHVDTAGGVSANMRSGAGLGYGVIAIIANGTVGTVDSAPLSADGYQWIRVIMPGGTGWMATVVLAAGGADGQGPTEVEVADGPLNVREWAGLDGTILRTIPTGATGQLTGLMPRDADGYVWVSVGFYSPNGVTGWVAGDFLQEI